MSMSSAPTLLREARVARGLTQSQLAERLGTTQAAVAKLERPGTNPTVATLRKALAAADHRLSLTADPAPSSVDLPQLLANLRLTPAERLERLEAAHRNVAAMVRGARA